MSDTYIHKEKGKFHNGGDLTDKLKKQFNRVNDDISEGYVIRNRKKEKVLKREYKNDLNA